jgi:hypothetical protein
VHAHGIAGARVFVGTLTFEDPAVTDELAFPTLHFQRQDDGTRQTDIIPTAAICDSRGGFPTRGVM